MRSVLHRAGLPGGALILLAVSAAPAAALDVGKVPMSFEANRGQVDQRVAFTGRGAGQTTFLTRRSALVDFGPRGALRVSFPGGAPARPVAQHRLKGVVNVYRGAKAYERIPTSARVRYRHVWKGIDAVFYGTQRQTEYDFALAPGADPSAIRVRLAGVRARHVRRNGDLVLRLRGGRRVVSKAPVTTQGARTVPSRYVLRGRRTVGFSVGRYDRSKTLTIDPVVVAYSTLISSNSSSAIVNGAARGNDLLFDVDVNAGGDAFVTGRTRSSSYPTTTGLNGYVANDDVVVTRVNATGSALVYSTIFGGDGEDQGLDIAVDPVTSVAYVSGNTNSTGTTFPTNPTQASLGDFDGFVAALTAAGTRTYVRRFGSSAADFSSAVDFDGAGNSYVGGVTYTTGGFPGAGNVLTTACDGDGAGDGFVLKTSPTGAALGGACINTTGETVADGLVVSDKATGATAITGSTVSTSGLQTAGAPQVASAGGRDAYLVRLDGAFAKTFGSYLGGTGYDVGFRVAVDSSGDAYVVGLTAGGGFPTGGTGATTTFGGGTYDGFLTRFTNAGARSFSSYLGGSGDDQAKAVDLDASNNVYVASQTKSSNFPLVNAYRTTAPSGWDVAVTKFNAGLATKAYSSFVGGGSSDDIPEGIAVDTAGAAYVAGYTQSSDYLRTPGSYSAFVGQYDGFVTKLDAATAARVSGLKATRLRRGVARVSWRAGTDPDAVGFEVLRRRGARGKLVKVGYVKAPSLGGPRRPAVTVRGLARRDRLFVGALERDGSKALFGPARFDGKERS